MTYIDHILWFESSNDTIVMLIIASSRLDAHYLTDDRTGRAPCGYEQP